MRGQCNGLITSRQTEQQCRVPGLLEVHGTLIDSVLTGECNAHVGSNNDTWRGVTGILDLNLSSVTLLEFCACHNFLNKHYVQAEAYPSVTPGHSCLEGDNEICCSFIKQIS